MLLHPSLANKEFNYDDILLQLNRLPDFSENEVDLSSQFTRNIRLKTPLSSAAMDTVTEADLAILMAMMGGIGVIHYNFPTINEQIAEVEKVKRFEAAFVRNPVVLSPRHTVKDIYEVHKKYGFYSCPITEDGTLETKLVGIVTHRDVRYIENMRTSLEEIMTKDVITVHRKNTLDTYNVKAVNKVIREHNLDTLVVVDDCYRVAAVVTDSDLRKDAAYPLATKDNNKQLLVFIATEGRLEKAKKRIYAAFEAEADGVVIDQSVAFREQVEIARFVKENCHGTEVVVGNVDSAAQVRALVEAGSRYIDAIKIGVGPGAACRTHEDVGVGRLQASAVYECANEMKRLEKEHGKIPIIADGGIKRPADIIKALALGADSVMVGWLLAGTDEAPGTAEYNWEKDRMEKVYRGMGSVEAMRVRSAARYTNSNGVVVPEGEAKKVGYKGSGYKLLPFITALMRRAMIKQGFRTVPELQELAHIVPSKFELSPF